MFPCAQGSQPSYSQQTIQGDKGGSLISALFSIFMNKNYLSGLLLLASAYWRLKYYPEENSLLFHVQEKERIFSCF